MASQAYEIIRSSGQLPSPTGVALRLLELTENEDTTIEAISSVVESDPAIAGRLLKVVDSPLAGMARHIASVTRAVALLGLRTVTSLALSFSLVKNFQTGKCAAFDYDHFWSDSLARATATRHVAMRLKKFAPDEAFTCGLLSKIGRLALATVFPERYESVLRIVQQGDQSELPELERSMFELDHNQISCEMMRDWHIPEVFRDAVLTQDSVVVTPTPDRTQLLAQLLNFAGLTSDVLTNSTVYREDLSGLIIKANRLGIAPDVFHEVFDAITEEWRGAAEVYQINSRRVPPLAEIYAQAHQRKVVVTMLEEQGQAQAVASEL